MCAFQLMPAVLTVKMMMILVSYMIGCRQVTEMTTSRTKTYLCTCGDRDKHPMLLDSGNSIPEYVTAAAAAVVVARGLAD